MSENFESGVIGLVAIVLICAIFGTIGYTIQKDREIIRKKIEVCQRMEDNNLKVTCLQTVTTPRR